MNTVYEINENIIVRNEDGVLFDMNNNVIIECNEVGFDIICKINGKATVDEIIKAMTSEYAADEEIGQAVVEFLEQCLEDKLIKTKK